MIATAKRMMSDAEGTIESTLSCDGNLLATGGRDDGVGPEL